MKIDINNPTLVAALNARLIKEYGETSAANFALDLIGDSLIAEKEALVAENAALRQREAELIEKTTADRQTILALRAELDGLRGRRTRTALKALD